MAALQFFVTQAVVRLGWTTPFSLSHNFISDLGNTACAPYPAGSTNYVCSPWHAWMNASFITLGLTKVAGAALICRAFRPGWMRGAGLGLLVISALGDVLVGLYPENVNIAVHRTGAIMTLPVGNLAIVLLGAALLAHQGSRTLGLGSIAAGSAGFAATILLDQNQFLGLGVGGIERISAYPTSLFMIAAGAYVWRRERRVPEPGGA